MFMAIIFLLFGVAAWVAVGVLPYFRRKTLGKTEAMRWVETSAATDMAAGTPVEVRGTLRCESLLESEMAGKACAYYLSQVVREHQETERDANGDLETRRRLEVVATNERFTPFAVEDGSGAVGVRAPRSMPSK